MIWKQLSLSFAVLAVAGVVFLWFLWEIGAFGNWGWESGYYGQFNRVQHVIEAMPNVKIMTSWIHKDVSLEDFAFTLRANGTTDVQVSFWENSPQMSERNKRKLREFIERQINSNQAVHAIGAAAPQHDG